MLGLMVWTFIQRFPVDDAFISYRYAANFARGWGFAWNLGERIEGFSNFLWTLLLGVGAEAGVAPERLSIILSSPFHFAALYLTYRISRQVGLGEMTSLLVLLLVGTTRSVYGFATSGLETSLQLTEHLALASILLEAQSLGWTRRRAFSASAVMALLILTRPDGVIPSAVAVYFFRKEFPTVNRSTRLQFALPVLIVGIIFAIWKLSYFGDLFPNSFHAKVRGWDRFGYGLFYLHVFGLILLLYPLAILAWFGHRQKPDRGYALIGTFTLTWLLYVVWAGGDFMEFRFLVPVTPFIFIWIIGGVGKLGAAWVSRAALAGLGVGVIQSNFALNASVNGYGMESLSHLREHIQNPDENWTQVGKRLREEFGGSSLKIGVGAAGAIPYFADLPTLDFLGLNDRNIPREGAYFTRVPGHQVIGSLDYVLRQGVNLIVEPNNHMLSMQEFADWSRNPRWQRDMTEFYLDVDQPVGGQSYDRAVLVAMPVDRSYVLLLWYLQPHPAMEEAIARNHWPVFPISRW